jgi:hypothetical protein
MTTDPHSTSAWLSVVGNRIGAENASRLRRLLVEVRAPSHYYEAISPETEGQRKRKARDEAIVELLAGFYGGPAGAKSLAKDWSLYAGTTFPRQKRLTTLPAGERPLRIALHRLSLLTDGRSLSAARISRIVAQVVEKT